MGHENFSFIYFFLLTYAQKAKISFYSL